MTASITRRTTAVFNVVGYIARFTSRRDLVKTRLPFVIGDGQPYETVERFIYNGTPYVLEELVPTRLCQKFLLLLTDETGLTLTIKNLVDNTELTWPMDQIFFFGTALENMEFTLTNTEAGSNSKLVKIMRG